MKRVFHSQHETHRCGSLLTEAIIACIVLGVAIGMLVPGLTAIGRQRQAVRFDTLAMIELNNITDVLRKSDVPATDVRVSEWFSHRYADSTLEVEPLPDTDVTTKDVLEGLRLSVRRPQAEAMPDQKVSIVVWRARRNPAP